MPRRPASPRVARLVLAAILLLPAPATAQVTEGPLSPAGRLRVEVAPSFFHWSERFGLRTEDGALVEETELLGFDLERDRASELFPGVAAQETRLRALLEDPSYQALLGSSRARVAHDVARVPLRVDLGIFEWLTVGVTVPFVRTRTEASLILRLDPEGPNLGLSPSVTAPSALAGFLEDLAGSAATARARAASLCGEDEAGCAAARALADDAESFESTLRAAYGLAPLFPAEGTAAGTGLRARLEALNERLAEAGLAGIDRSLPLAEGVLDAETVLRLFSDARAGLGDTPSNVVGLWELGDVELTAAVRLLEGEARDSAEAPARARWQVGARALVRLGTGQPDDPDRFLDLGTGDGQTDVEGGVFANGRVGAWGLWADARYGVQSPVDLLRRAVPADVVLAPVATRVPVRWTPGSYLQVELSPRWHVTTELAVAASWRLFHKGEDTYELAAPAPPDATFPDPSVLEAETGQTLHELGGGLVFSTLEAWREGRTDVPFEVRFGVQAGVAGSGGRTPKGVRVQTGLRIYQPLWGR
ncbi:MAG: hypothetical protein KY453_03020 [Gemmatimonadetes bacterium]|nr:hypothetical protein [Gemmatimonadota bacterium]